MNTKSLFAVLNRKKEDVLFQTATSPCLHFSNVMSRLLPHTQLLCNSPGPHFSNIPSTVFHLTWHNIVLEKDSSKFTSFFLKPSLCFAYWFLKFTSKVYPLLLFLTFVNTTSMNTTKCSSQYLLSELCRLWWCLTNWLWDKKVHIIYSGYLGLHKFI